MLETITGICKKNTDSSAQDDYRILTYVATMIRIMICCVSLVNVTVRSDDAGFLGDTVTSSPIRVKN